MQRIIFTYLILLIMITQNSCAQQEHQEEKYTNQLINETSPYLIQHAHNPVNWYPYGKEALDKAQKEDKLILFSIGYAACHWCHVMEHESFENVEVAQIMNDHFICIKVDKEERPDVDQVYMNAVQLLTGSGGWPLNCFALPDGRPVWGGTYFGTKDWKNILQNLSTGYKNDKERFIRSAKELTRGIVQTELISVRSEATLFSNEDLEHTVEAMKQRFDYVNGGFVGQPKFPMPGIYDFLLDYALVNKDWDLLEHISFTLKKWAYGGIYDQIGGGFARYSVDSKWLVPHFEKMLYDNGQILALYAKLYRVTKEPVFKRIVEETSAWIKREMTNEDGMFYASFDADSEGEEGLFYVWTKAEIDQILGDESNLFCQYYGVSKNGNFEGKSILNVDKMKEASEDILKLRNILFEEREKRIKPALDHKKLTAWNALTISGLCESYLATGNEAYLSMAKNSAETILEKYITNKGVLLRLYKKKHSVSAFMDDYALLIEAFLNLYKVTFDDKWLVKSILLTEKANQLFYDNTSGMYFYTAVNEQVVVRKMEITDNVIPASNSVMAKNLYQLSILLDDTNMREKAIQILKNSKNQSLKSPTYSYNTLHLFLQLNQAKKELIIVGDKANEKRMDLLKNYYPFILVSGSLKENKDRPLLLNRYRKEKTLFYFCENNACKMPVETIAELESILK